MIKRRLLIQLRAIPFIVGLVLCGGCASTLDTFDFSSLISPLLGSAAGVTAYKFLDEKNSDGTPKYTDNEKLLGTAVAAGGTYVASEMVRHHVLEGYDKEFMKGYDLGASDTVKRQYWIIQNLNKIRDDRSRHDRFKYYTFPGKSVGSDGRKYVDHDVILRVVE